MLFPSEEDFIEIETQSVPFSFTTSSSGLEDNEISAK